MTGTLTKPPLKLTSFILSNDTRTTLRRIKQNFGVSYTFSVARGIALMEAELTAARPGGVQSAHRQRRAGRRNRKGE